MKSFALFLSIVAVAIASEVEPFHNDGNATSTSCILGTQTGCSTDVVSGLTTQIINEVFFSCRKMIAL
jgi:hypothetical protein